MAHVGIDQHRGAALADRADFAQCHGDDVGGERDRLGMEIAAADDLVRIREQDRIVGHRIGFDRQRARGVGEQIEAGAHYLWLAAETVGILHPIAIVVAGGDIAAVEQRAQPGRDRDLAGLAAQVVDARVERGAAAFQSVNRKCAGMECSVEHALPEKQGVERDCGRGLGAVDQREAFLWREDQRIAAHVPERFGGGEYFAGEVDAAFAHQRSDHVRERGEIARRADAALAGDERHCVGVEQGHQRVDHVAPHPRMAATETDQFEDDHQPRDVAGKRWPKPAAVAEDQIALKVGELVGGDTGLREQAKAGVDAVHGRAAGDDPVNASGGGVDPGQRVVGQAGGRAGPQ